MGILARKMASVAGKAKGFVRGFFFWLVFAHVASSTQWDGQRRAKVARAEPPARLAPLLGVCTLADAQKKPPPAQGVLVEAGHCELAPGFKEFLYRFL